MVQAEQKLARRLGLRQRTARMRHSRRQGHRHVTTPHTILQDQPFYKEEHELYVTYKTKLVCNLAI